MHLVCVIPMAVVSKLISSAPLFGESSPKSVANLSESDERGSLLLVGKLLSFLRTSSTSQIKVYFGFGGCP